jgi:hypothetical protein
MRKTIYGAFVIIFVVFACLLVINEINSTSKTEVDTQQYYADSE